MKNIQLSDLKLKEFWTTIRRGVLYTLYLLGALILQNVIFSHVAPLGVRAMFMPALVTAVALFEGGRTGGIFGLLRGALLCFVLFALMPLLQTVIPVEGLGEMLQASTLAPLFNSGNLILSIMNGHL